MSLGWNTESALLPKKAKPISVGNKSLLALKAVVYEKEQQQQQQQQLKHDGLNSSSSMRSQRGGHMPNKKKDVFGRSNKGIEARAAKEDPLKIAKSDKIYAALKAKSELYDQLQSNASLSKSGTNAFLVDFSSKSTVDEVASSSSSSSSSTHSAITSNERGILDDNDYSDVEDEFGRSKRVHRKSQEYIAITLERERKRRRKMYSSGGLGHYTSHDEEATSRHEYGSEEEIGRNGRESEEVLRVSQPQWAWSTGHAHKNDHDHGREGEIENYSADYKAKLLLQNRVESEISQAARVKSHWEKTISGKAKRYLEEIHSETMDLKKITSADSDCAKSTAVDDSSKIASNNLVSDSRFSAKEDRRAMIKRLREEKKKSSSSTSTTNCDSYSSSEFKHEANIE